MGRESRSSGDDSGSAEVGLTHQDVKEKGSWIVAASLADLAAHDEEIVDRINGLPNGGYLFALHPFRFLAELGISLSGDARATLLKREPALALHSDAAYEAVKASIHPQPVTIVIRRLFTFDEGDEDETR